MVYVGKKEYKYGRMIMSHMVADSLDELHEMARSIGIDIRHFQNKKDRPHYDICKTKKQIAIHKGAIEVSDREIIKILTD